MYRGGGDGTVRGLSMRGIGLEEMEHVCNNGCSAWGPLSMSESAFVSYVLHSHLLPQSLIWFIYILWLLPCNFLFSMVCFQNWLFNICISELSISFKWKFIHSALHYCDFKEGINLCSEQITTVIIISI